jgi:hypothetical protein
MQYEMTIRIGDLELLQELFGATVQRGGTIVDVHETEARVIGPERRLPAATKQKIAELQRDLGVTSGIPKRKHRMRRGGPSKGYSDAVRSYLADGKEHSPLEVREALVAQGLLPSGGSQNSLSSMFVRLIKQAVPTASQSAQPLAADRCHGRRGPKPRNLGLMPG